MPVAEWRRLLAAARPSLKQLLLSDEARTDMLTPARGVARRRKVTAAGVERMYLLDTNVVSELRKPRPHGAVVAWLQATADADLHMSAVTLGEIQAGIELTREQDPAKAAEIEAWADLVAASRTTSCRWTARRSALGRA
ncbi:MAG: PIN domain-containing protein [Rhodopseudomonas palustris]|nr:PIN domain-containing protein [Rhodopseudomonas palustris]